MGAVVNGAGGPNSERAPLACCTTAAAIATAFAPSCCPVADKRLAMSFSAGTTQSFVAGKLMEVCLASMRESNNLSMVPCRLSQAADAATNVAA